MTNFNYFYTVLFSRYYFRIEFDITLYKEDSESEVEWRNAIHFKGFENDGNYGSRIPLVSVRYGRQIWIFSGVSNEYSVG